MLSVKGFKIIRYGVHLLRARAVIFAVAVDLTGQLDWLTRFSNVSHPVSVFIVRVASVSLQPRKPLL